MATHHMTLLETSLCFNRDTGHPSQITPLIQPWVGTKLVVYAIMISTCLLGGYMYLDLNYTDPTNLTRAVQLISSGYDITKNGMGHKDVCLHGWLAGRQLSCISLINGLSGTRCQGDKDTSQNYQLLSGCFLSLTNIDLIIF